jgi:hypothetical protein
MGQGLQIFNPSGQLVLDTASGLGRVLGTLDVSQAGSLDVPALSSGRPFAFATVLQTPRGNITADVIQISFNGTLMSWQFRAFYYRNPLDVLSAYLTYGVY